MFGQKRLSLAEGLQFFDRRLLIDGKRNDFIRPEGTADPARNDRRIAAIRTGSRRRGRIADQFRRA